MTSVRWPLDARCRAAASLVALLPPESPTTNTRARMYPLSSITELASDNARERFDPSLGTTPYSSKAACSSKWLRSNAGGATRNASPANRIMAIGRAPAARDRVSSASRAALKREGTVSFKVMERETSATTIQPILCRQVSSLLCLSAGRASARQTMAAINRIRSQRRH